MQTILKSVGNIGYSMKCCQLADFWDALWSTNMAIKHHKTITNMFHRFHRKFYAPKKWFLVAKTKPRIFLESILFCWNPMVVSHDITTDFLKMCLISHDDSYHSIPLNQAFYHHVVAEIPAYCPWLTWPWIHGSLSPEM